MGDCLETQILYVLLVKPNIILYHAFSLNIYKYSKYHQHKYCHNQLKNQRHIHITQSFLYYQLKILSTEILPNAFMHEFLFLKEKKSIIIVLKLFQCTNIILITFATSLLSMTS